MSIVDQLHFEPKKELGEFQKRNITASRVMGDENAKKLWEYISKNFEEAAKWALIPEEEPDEWDLEMLEEIKHDPDCHIFAPAEEVERLLLGTPLNEDRTA